ncbi:replication protein RepA [Burkholderia gladioli]|uniref:replication protein RepA n=1 Tax=Burkholderia gladioli TaxID=28095 RepID=UPI001C5F91F3|nr:replication protein RepA [Burkholderia gladioli]MBW5284199.1 RepA [Burkholderia gladioli]
MRGSLLQLVRAGSESSASSTESFDEAAYREKLIKAGVSPTDAQATARNTAIARGASDARIVAPGQSQAAAADHVFQLDLLSPADEIAADSPHRPTHITPSACALPPSVVTAPAAEERAAELVGTPSVRSTRTRNGTRKKEEVPLSKRQRALIEEALCLEQEEAGGADATGYLARTLAQVTIPHVDPKLPLGQMYVRDTGKLTLTVVPTSKRHGVPYGVIPRMILAWICTEVVQTKERTLDLGRSQSEFMGQVGLHRNGRDIQRFRDQSLRLFKSVIAVEQVDQHADESRRLMISDQSSVFWHPTVDDQRSLWSSSLELTEGFYKEILRAPVPIKMEVYHALAKAPFAMDIYTWLTYRMFVLQRSGKSVVSIPWIALKLQFGSGYADTKQGLYDFRANFKKRLREVLLFYREAEDHVKDIGDHLQLTPSKLHIQPRG